MKIHRKTHFLLYTLTILTFILMPCMIASAQQDLAQEAYLIFQQNCLNCHGPHGTFTEKIVIDSASGLVDAGAVVPGVPIQSELYTRLLETNPTKRMPLGGQLSPQAILTIGNWIQAGAPDWNLQHDVSFIATSTMLTTMQQHLQTLDPFDRPFARYFTMTHLYNAGETLEALNAYNIALSKLVNSLSWGFDIRNPQPIDAAETVFYIDLRDYEWDIRDTWTQIENAYPYEIEFDADAQARLRTKLESLRQTMSCEVPYVYIDWFLATAVLPPLYHNILDLPGTDRELERDLEVDVQRNLQSAPGRRVWRAGTNNSGVSNHNRVVERHTSRYGAYWKSYDFAGSIGTQNIFTHPLSFEQDGGEVIFNLPNGLQAYYISDAAGNRIDVAPTEIVSNPAANDPAVHNGLSCIGCHTEGMKTFEDEVRAAIQQTRTPRFDKAHALRLYVEQATMDRLLAEDTQRYKDALEKTGGVFGGIEPVHRFYETYQGPVDAAYAAAAVGMKQEAFLTEVRKKSSLQALGLTPLVNNGSVKRDVWTSQFSAIVSALRSPDVQTPAAITTVSQVQPLLGSTVRIPDTNLRAAIAETLGKAPNAVITPEDMKGLTRLRADGRGIQDLTGLEYATNLERIELRRNAISDLTPLRGLIRLNNIKLRDNVISDVSPLANLISVDWMGLEENIITDVSPLKGLVKLEGIGISENLVTDVSPLASLTSLERIDAWNVPITDFSALAKLPKLEWIEFGNDASVTTIPSLKGIKRLRRLELNNCSITDLTPLKEFTQLEWLELVNNTISDLAPLRSLKNLRTLNLDANVISDISPLAELTQLELLYLENNVISDLSPLRSLKRLETVNLDANIISDVSPLAELTQLEVLYLENNTISDVSPLAGLKNLERLDLRNNAIVDFSPLDELQLSILNFRMSGNPGFTGGGKITGPWLWMIVSTGNTGGAAAARSGVDFLSVASNGKVTELKVATNGATEGNPVGDRVWEVGDLSATGGNNLNDMANKTGLGFGDINNHVAYGALILESPGVQKTKMLVGSDDAVKVWLNGTLVHDKPVDRGANDFQEQFPVTLKQGYNTLLVAVYERGGRWSGFFGFARDAKYTVIPPGTTKINTTTPTVPAWDVNEDGKTDLTDQLIVMADIGKNPPANPRSDVNGDGTVDIKDVALVASHLGETNQPAAPTTATLPPGITFKVVQDALDHLRAADDGSFVFRRGIAKLEKLLTLFVPEETALLHNYPNPFNPETWIPYQLAELANVTVHIYATNGVLVRTLSLGHQPAGIYQHRSRAAYWDGRNNIGEPVASGVYFYTLTAGDFTATRKMLIRK
ncbi:MAG: leucine-rich repeat domain-containing protein [Candidatus Poribacteria bacterium]|nr:leucine-rich repeat domain-containing protein [Candidatus Poribacteria bacterium]